MFVNCGTLCNSVHTEVYTLADTYADNVLCIYNALDQSVFTHDKHVYII